MRKRIIENINSPGDLEKLYRENSPEFSSAFNQISDEYDSELVRFWKIRLAPVKENEFKGFLKLDLFILLGLSLLTALLIKIPLIFTQINEESFFMRNLAIIVFNGIILFSFWQNKIAEKKWIYGYGACMLLLVSFINLLPTIKGDSVVLAFIHTPLFLWCIFGLVYVSFDFKNYIRRIEFIRFNGELLIMTGLILLAGGLLTAITLGLFTAIKMNIEKFYIEYVAFSGAVAAPMVALYLVKLYPTITNKIAPVIARVFTPIVLITLAVYLISLVFSKSNIQEDRELLILFNIMLLAVTAIIVFSLSELSKSDKSFNVLMLFALALLAIVINAIALFAIITRLTEGFTPNRTVVLVSNVLIFVNLVQIALNLLQVYFTGKPLRQVEVAVAKYLPVYFAWTIIVIFVLPFVFGMK
jgi:hypothetical protein